MVWQSKGLRDESVKPPTGNSLVLRLGSFDSSCLKHGMVTFAPKK